MGHSLFVMCEQAHCALSAIECMDALAPINMKPVQTREMAIQLTAGECNKHGQQAPAITVEKMLLKSLLFGLRTLGESINEPESSTKDLGSVENV